MKNRIYSKQSFEVWINDQPETETDDQGLFDNNWIVSGVDLFNSLELTNDELLNYYDEAA